MVAVDLDVAAVAVHIDGRRAWMWIFASLGVPGQGLRHRAGRAGHVPPIKMLGGI